MGLMYSDSSVRSGVREARSWPTWRGGSMSVRLCWWGMGMWDLRTYIEGFIEEPHVCFYGYCSNREGCVGLISYSSYRNDEQLHKVRTRVKGHIAPVVIMRMKPLLFSSHRQRQSQSDMRTTRRILPGRCSASSPRGMCTESFDACFQECSAERQRACSHAGWRQLE